MTVTPRFRDGLQEEVLAANLGLVRHGLVTLTWGNASGIDREAGVVAIKASGVSYETMGVDDVVVLSFDGEVLNSNRRPSTDTATHLALYRAFPEIGGVVHTHSTWATAFAQAEREIPILGTTHADFCPTAIPLARYLSVEEITSAYEHNTGIALQELIEARGIDELPAALIRGHGPFAWGDDANKALERAATLEAIAEMAFLTLSLRHDVPALGDDLINKHFKRKHGPDAYYGQHN